MEVLFIGWFFLAVVIGTVAAIKGKNFALWFFLSAFLSPLLAGFCLVITLMPGQNNSNVLAIKDEFEEKWTTLIKYDEGTKKAVKLLEIYGSDAIDELKKVLRATNDPSRLPIIADQIAKDFQIEIRIRNEKQAIQAARDVKSKSQDPKKESPQEKKIHNESVFPRSGKTVSWTTARCETKQDILPPDTYCSIMRYEAGYAIVEYLNKIYKIPIVCISECAD